MPDGNDSHFGHLATTSTARVLEVFLLYPENPFTARQLATQLGWDIKTGTRMAQTILVRLEGYGWLFLYDLVKPPGKGSNAKSYLLTQLGQQQGQLLVEEVQSREALLAIVMGVLLEHSGTWLTMSQISRGLNLDPHYFAARIGAYIERGWVLSDGSGGRTHFVYTFNPDALDDIQAFISMVAARYPSE